MKVHIGDVVESVDFGAGTVIAMTKLWCIYAAKNGCEFAMQWDEISIPAEGPNVCHTQEIEHDI